MADAPSGIAVATMSKDVPAPVQRNIHTLVGHVETMRADLTSLKTTVASLPDPTGPLSKTQVDAVRQQLLGSNNLIQQVQGFSALPNIPVKDPKVKGALWNNAGVLSVSAG